MIFNKNLMDKNILLKEFDSLWFLGIIKVMAMFGRDTNELNQYSKLLRGK